MKETGTYLIMLALGLLAYAYPHVEFYRVVLCIYTTLIIGVLYLLVAVLFGLSFVLDKPLSYSKTGKPLLSRNMGQWGIVVAKTVSITWMFDAIGWHNTAGAYFVAVIAVLAILLHLEHKLGYNIKGE